LIKKGQVIVDEVPAPMVDKNSVLVEVRYSLISTGTELARVASSDESLLRKAVKVPVKVKRALTMMATQGVSQTIDKARGLFDTAYPTGYSCSGTVIDVGQGISDIKVGDRVACAGAGKANHAEIVSVPWNLLVKIPEGVNLKYAASITLGAIAMQGVRRAEPRFGDIITVIGLGLIGQITVLILKAAGCHVIGIDISKSRVELAKNLDMDYGVASGEEDPVNTVLRYSSGYGADATIITAATKSNEPAELAMEITRKKGRVVVVGDVGLHLKRQPFYEKELDFLISTSYGPGRYDELYEEKGIDYPYAYVRWTEKRNMQEYLRMLALANMNIEELISREYPVEEAAKAYDDLKSESRPLAVLLKYKESPDTLPQKLTRKVIAKGPFTIHPLSTPKLLNVALIGAGDFAKSVHLPNLKRLSNLYNIYAIVSNTGSNAKGVAKRYGAVYATTDYGEVLRDENVNVVLICTRHKLHARMAIEALKAGKHIFVEKPLCLNRQELSQICSLYVGEKGAISSFEMNKSPCPATRYLSAINHESRTKGHSSSAIYHSPLLTVGFNRRFSPYGQRIKEITKNRLSPMIINYRMNAGYIPLNHWVHTEEGGGRNIGEACHIYDLFNFFTDSEAVSVEAKSITPKSEQYVSNDNFVATIKYKDGSLCNLTYTALGSTDYPKEEMEIYVDGKILKMVDYEELEISGAKYKGLQTKTREKGYLEELKAFYKAFREGGEPIPLWQLIQATEISLSVEEKIQREC